MKIITTIPALKKTLKICRQQGQTIGFVPTMGALHDGHLSLVRRCKQDNNITVLSIFVNPSQFGPDEDYHHYPRTKKRDILLAKKSNVDIIFSPTEKGMYSRRCLTTVFVDRLSDTLCGKSRPGHFRGVATVVAKLLNIVQPDTLYLGQKDAQQCVVIRQMVQDLNFPVKVVTVPTFREPDGLAMSSRNRYLSKQERQEAVVLYQSLCLARRRINNGERKASRILTEMRGWIQNHSSAKIDYIECVDAATLEPVQQLSGIVLIALAVRFNSARLIDHIMLRIRRDPS